MHRTLLFSLFLGSFFSFSASAQDIFSEPAESVRYDWNICARYEKRHTCVVDGDTIWLQGTKMRLLEIDAPEVRGQCDYERKLAQQSTRALVAFLSEGIVKIETKGQDRYGRTLVKILTPNGDIGQLMIRYRYAKTYGKRDKMKWCRSRDY